MTFVPSYYEILDLPEAFRDEANLPAQTLRNAYRRALLQNHPDKSANGPLTSTQTRYSIDQITEAFSTLSIPKSRAKYDTDLKLQNAAINSEKSKQILYTGIETVDLDDLEVDEARGIWFKSCRCGEDQGFLIKEADLDEAASEGEISVGCRGCSLWLKVLFGVIEDDILGVHTANGTTEVHENK
ncbi:Diphthamide biosynthesis protein 4 [Mollisia scopiformis]|uniref:Diphthamide biosynthesis protein 4 n=1 Tax=Mollisia scopiformis TaxID=149040 RepID=A0A194XQE8_MOLSC|nr:Diphthamide biosynthesis protein 4 [Mollisia scopiformis]KUJ22485.1 Diphthamide biosynthesis protein 4 [Mollisia scopiformis]